MNPISDDDLQESANVGITPIQFKKFTSLEPTQLRISNVNTARQSSQILALRPPPYVTKETPPTNLQLLHSG